MISATVFDTFSVTAIFLMLIVAYAEIHFRLPGIPSKLFKREPEIIFDIPSRLDPGIPLPLYLFVKDAHLYPAFLLRIEVTIFSPDGRKKAWNFEMLEKIESSFYSKTFHLELEELEGTGELWLNASLEYAVNGKPKLIQQDNYSGIHHQPFRFFTSAHTLPNLPGLHWGDAHVHTLYTSDQIEFGAPLSETADCAKSSGLSFLAITDHSYDLDDLPDDYTQNDPQLQKWQQLQQEAKEVTKNSGVQILVGEEVSVGNSRGENVHCLLIGNQTFQPGNGDSGEQPLNNKPTMSLQTLFERISTEPDVIVAAAHPFEEPPASQRLLLNRGYWREDDLASHQLHYWQILNGIASQTFERGLATWIDALKNGRRIALLAGNDAHGNFNTARQIAVPLYRMERLDQQVLGRMRSGLLLNTPLSPKALLETLRKGRGIISNGPAISLELELADNIFQIGDRVLADQPSKANLTVTSTTEFGDISKIHLIVGNCESCEEELHQLEPQSSFQSSHNIQFQNLPTYGYLRAAVYCESTNCFAYSNPIWLGKSERVENGE